MKNKGFTMVELLVSLGISSIIAGLIFSFFIINYKGYKSVRNDAELRFQAQYILNFMAGKIINCTSMSFARNYTDIYSMTAVRSVGEKYPVNKLSFKFGFEGNNYVFHIVENSIRYGIGQKDKVPAVELGSYVDGMYISVLRDESFQNARAIKLEIVMKKDGQMHRAFQAVYMRNNLDS